MSLPKQVQYILDEAHEMSDGQYDLGTSVPVMNCPILTRRSSDLLKNIKQLESLGYKFDYNKTMCFGDRLYICKELNAFYILDHY